LEAYAARLALVHHVVSRVSRGEDDCDPVEPVSVEAGITLARWFGNEAERVYAVLAESAEARAARQLVEYLRQHGGEATARDLHKANRSRFPTPEAAEAALNKLAHDGIGYWCPTSSTRPSSKFRLGSVTPYPVDPNAPAGEPPQTRADGAGDSPVVTPPTPGTLEISKENKGIGVNGVWGMTSEAPPRAVDEGPNPTDPIGVSPEGTGVDQQGAAAACEPPQPAERTPTNEPPTTAPPVITDLSSLEEEGGSAQ
jgi:hypothetical protein